MTTRPPLYRSFALILSVFACCWSGPTLPAFAADLEVSAGESAEAIWTVPTKVSAGEPFTAKLEVRDRYGNVVTDYDKRGTWFEISVLGRGEIWPKTVLAKSFVKGVADVQMIYKVAERIEIVGRSLGGVGGKLEARSAPFHVIAGKLSDIRVVVPASARAGTPFRVSLTAQDAFGNPIKNFHERTDGVILTTDGYGVLNPPRVGPAAFIDGVAEIGATYTGTGEVEVRAKDPKSGVASRSSNRVKFGAGEPKTFKLTAPAVAYVDEAFDVALTALDEFGNVVLDYDSVGTMLFLSADGTATISPAEVPAKKFAQGVAFVKVAYDRPENISVIATEPGTLRAGTSAPIEIQPGKARRLELSAESAVDAGSPFTVKIRVMDSKGNTTQPPNTKIMLTVAGTVATSPIEIAPSSFKAGSADRKITYNVAEEILISAQDAPGYLMTDPVRVRIRPGPAAGVEVTVPPTVAAGIGIPIQLVAMDAYRNTVTEFHQTHAKVLARVESQEAPPPTEVSASAFSQGKASVTLPYYRGGAVRVSAELAGDAARLGRSSRTTSGPVEILPAALHHFEIAAPQSATAGMPFRVTLTAKDAYANSVTDYNRTGGGVSVHSSGVAEIQPAEFPPSAFKAGIAQIELRSYAAERIVLTVVERFGSATGRSGQVKITPGPLALFLVSVSPKIRAGELFPIRIEAQDVYYNTVKDFISPGKIVLSVSGQSKIQPSEISATDFVDGISLVQASLTTAGAAELTVSTEDRKAIGRSNPITVLPSAAATYKVDVLDPVTAGEPFRVRVSALDAYGNAVEDARMTPRPIRLEASGAGGLKQITPSVFSPQLFTRGIAEGYLVYPHAGRVTIQVKGEPASFREADPAESRSQVEGLFFKAGKERTDVFLLASGPLEYRVSQPTQLGGGSNMLVVTIPNATVLRTFDQEGLKLPGVTSAKLVSDAGGGGRLVLKLESSYGYSLVSRANLIQATVRSGAPAGPATLTLPPSPTTKSDIPTLANIQSMIDAGDYRTAQRAVELFLSAHPGHPEAAALRTRLEKVLKVIGE